MPLMSSCHVANVANWKDVRKGQFGLAGIVASLELYAKRLVLGTVASHMRLQAMVSVCHPVSLVSCCSMLHVRTVATLTIAGCWCDQFGFVTL
jgi:hypothetical protein